MCHTVIPSKWKQTPFTLIELLVVIVIIAILASLLFPMLGRARAKARQIACMSQLRQLNYGIQLYGGDHDGWIMPTNDWWLNYQYNLAWFFFIGHYLSVPKLADYPPTNDSSKNSWVLPDQWQNSILICPDYSARMHLWGATGLYHRFLGGYGKNRRLPPSETTDELGWGNPNTIVGWDWVAQYRSFGNYSYIDDPEERILLGDGKGSNGDLGTFWQARDYNDYDIDKYRHLNQGANINYVDGHCDFLKAPEIVWRATNEHAKNYEFPFLFRKNKKKD